MDNYDFYDRIKDYYDLSFDEIERILNLSKGYISKARRGKISSPDKLVFALKKEGLNTNYFLTGEGTPKSFSSNKYLPKVNQSDNLKNSFLVPLLDMSVSAGRGTLLPDSDQIKTLLPAPEYLSHYGDNLAALCVDGDSMEPTLSRGDMIICDSLGWDGEGIYAIHMNGCGFVKRISQKPGKIVVMSDNPAYTTFEEPAESEALKIIGRVHCVIRSMD